MVNDVGLIWRMNATKTFEQNVIDGVSAHFMKFKRDAEVIEAHPDDLNGQGVEIDGVRVTSSIGRLKNELFIGTHEAAGKVER